MTPDRRWFLLVATALVAAGLGFGIARWTESSPPPAPPPASPSGPAALTLADREIAAAGILVEPATQGNLAAEILAPAVTAAQPNGQASLTAHATGMISRLNKRLGDPVKAGEVLAVVDSPDAAALASDRASAVAKADLARKIEAQEAALYREGATSRRSLETAQANLAAAEADARRARDAAASSYVSSDGHSVVVRSPLTGRITAEAAALGAYVNTQTELFRVADPRFVQVEAQLTATDADRVAPGDVAILMLPSGAPMRTTVHSITPALDPQTRTKTVVISVPEGQILAPGETLQVRIIPRGTTMTGIVVPEEAVQSLDGRDTVFVRTATGFVVRPVRVANRSGGRASIMAGLNPGEGIATHSAFLLKAELGKGAGDEE